MSMPEEKPLKVVESMQNLEDLTLLDFVSETNHCILHKIVDIIHDVVPLSLLEFFQ